MRGEADVSAASDAEPRASRAGEQAGYSEDRAGGAAEDASRAASTCALELDDVSFAYPKREPVLRHLSWRLACGAFALVTGEVGSGKSTLLRLLKPGLAPNGRRAGRVEIQGRELSFWSREQSAREVGFVAQDPETHIVCDVVERELAFALENLGMPQDEMRRAVAGVAHYLGIAPLVRRRCAELSGGELQVVALGSALAPFPELLLLDEPTARLDPLAAQNLMHLLFRINRELGTSIVVCTHSPQLVAPYASCAFELREGRLVELDVQGLRPQPQRAGGAVRGGDRVAAGAARAGGDRTADVRGPAGAIVVRVDDAHYRYGRSLPEALRGVDLRVCEGEVCALVGANGSGKTTLLKLLAGVLRPQRGSVRNAAAQRQALLPQNPKELFVRDSVAEELGEWQRSAGYTDEERLAMAERLGLAQLLDAHPYDLSGGQQQLLALGKLLLTRPELLILDEPTQGMDPGTRLLVARELRALAKGGAAVLFASHDLAFVSRVADRVALVFDGEVACDQACGDFFADNLFYPVVPDGFTQRFDEVAS